MKTVVDNHTVASGGTVFVSGIHGVGKTTLCKAVAEKTGVKHVSAGDLIEQNRLRYEQFPKTVKGGESEFICRCIEEILPSSGFLLVDGHFALFDRSSNVVRVDYDIYRRIKVHGIFVLVDNVCSIQQRIEKRDGQLIGVDLLNVLQDAEVDHAGAVARRLGVQVRFVDVSQVDFGKMVNDVRNFIATPSRCIPCVNP